MENRTRRIMGANWSVTPNMTDHTSSDAIALLLYVQIRFHAKKQRLQWAPIMNLRAPRQDEPLLELHSVGLYPELVPYLASDDHGYKFRHYWATEDALQGATITTVYQPLF
ncbi:hypothetical protein VNO77_37700 [Canavalia gladiata]|uniref:Uncharacterized protein n=1 Tax=Canavalia gladiata TaxID=3824 RepID=A0AAN9K8G7_CANGL